MGTGPRDFALKREKSTMDAVLVVSGLVLFAAFAVYAVLLRGV